MFFAAYKHITLVCICHDSMCKQIKKFYTLLHENSLHYCGTVV